MSNIYFGIFFYQFTYWCLGTFNKLCEDNNITDYCVCYCKYLCHKGLLPNHHSRSLDHGLNDYFLAFWLWLCLVILPSQYLITSVINLFYGLELSQILSQSLTNFKAPHIWSNQFSLKGQYFQLHYMVARYNLSLWGIMKMNLFPQFFVFCWS
jgi:hypothetical protein